MACLRTILRDESETVGNSPQRSSSTTLNPTNQPTVNIWCGIWREMLVGPLFFVDDTLISKNYVDLFCELSSDFLDEHVSKADLTKMSFSMMDYQPKK